MGGVASVGSVNGGAGGYLRRAGDAVVDDFCGVGAEVAGGVGTLVELEGGGFAG